MFHLRFGRTRSRHWSFAAALCFTAACNAPGGPGSADDTDWARPGPATERNDAATTVPPPAADAGILDAEGPPQVAACLPARGSEKLFPRARTITLPTATDPGTPPPPPPVASMGKPAFASDLFSLFNNSCGSCHVKAESGNFKVAQQTFAADMDKAFEGKKNQDRVLDAMNSNDPTLVMPPPVSGGKIASKRQPGDPTIELLELLKLWFAQGRPNVFTIPSNAPANPVPDPVVTPETEAPPSYLVTEEVATQLTNIGSCVPTRAMVGSSVATMDKLDLFFASAKELPDSLAETDMTSLDGAVQAKQGLVAFAPTYPLWSDGSAKMRAVRVPRGKSIVFDKAKQEFTIPPNTRFYKTFLKKIVDVDGNPSFRKIETRLIVSRPDERQSDGKFAPKALYGTYIWNEDETEAKLTKDQLRDGSVFADKLLTYVVDEPKAQQIRDSNPFDLSKALDDDNPGVTRRYAIPGKQRCLECHMGAANASFVLGFTPLQLNRRPTDQGGTYEPTGADEMTQLQRMIDYGLITGMTSPADVLLLEDSQGSRKPRKLKGDTELKAQAYLLGNCAHCHNPRGFPSINAPDLVEALNFLPSEKGGIFQFPLTRMSPLRRRGVRQDIEMPYITPSLRDFKSQPDITTDLWRPKFQECAEDGSTTFCNPHKKVQFIEAPWRSLIYRNVDTPFIYAEDFTIFPHMPRDTAGFDCRAPRIMADWMVSIPARRKNPKISEDETENPESTPQPYEEVLPTDPDYPTEQGNADARIAQYRAGKRRDFCPDTSDIVDHYVLKGKTPIHLVPIDEPFGIYADAKRTMTVMPPDSVPDKPHFVVTDLTDAVSEDASGISWSPRRPDWDTQLIKPTPNPRNDVDVPSMLKDITLTPQLKDFAATKIPMGLWAAKADCEFDKSGVRKVSDIPEAERRAWMAGKEAERVYEVTPGEAVFQNICINCHGPQADSQGLLAAAVAEMTGGSARVANFKVGLLGPPEMPKKNWQSVFAPFAQKHGGSAEDWAQRYLVWMALGGTTAALPPSILSIVGTTPVVGQRRESVRFAATPNMLETAQQLCIGVVGAAPTSGGQDTGIPINQFFEGKRIRWSSVQGGLIDSNGDAELWARLCSMDNRPVVRVFTLRNKDKLIGLLDAERYWGDAYPADAPVMNHLGHVDPAGIQKDNLVPTCFAEPTPDKGPVADVQRTAPSGELMPYCPKAWLAAQDDNGEPKYKFKSHPSPVVPGETVFTDANRWAARGAVNAGLAVFQYLQQLESCAVSPTPGYNNCGQLGKSTCSKK
jgi:mono/diheme cytochrome c family protein